MLRFVGFPRGALPVGRPYSAGRIHCFFELAISELSVLCALIYILILSFPKCGIDDIRRIISPSPSLLLLVAIGRYHDPAYHELSLCRRS